MHVKYQQEFLETVKADALPLLERHWEEIALNKDKIKLDPDWEAYETLELNGNLAIFTARVDEELVGYFVVIVGSNIHYKSTIFAENDLIYIAPEYRKGRIGANLIKFAQRYLKNDGVSVLNINTKTHKPFGKLLTYLGFNKIEEVYSKYLGD